MLVDGVDLLDPEAVQGWRDAFNERPLAERDAFLAGRLGPADVALDPELRR